MQRKKPSIVQVAAEFRRRNDAVVNSIGDNYRFVTGPQIDVMLGISRWTRCRWITQGHLPKAAIKGPPALWRLSELKSAVDRMKWEHE